MKKKYEVVGRYSGKRVKEVVVAVNKKQAKLIAGYKSGFGGSPMKGFMRSRDIRIRPIK